MQIIINSLINQNNIITNQKIDVFNKTNWIISIKITIKQ
jgi:hypothetical protein